MKRRTGTFTAHSDDGREYTIHIYTDYVNAGSFENPNAVAEGLKELRTSDGLHVNRIEKGLYKIVESDIVLRSDSPDVP